MFWTSQKSGRALKAKKSEYEEICTAFNILYQQVVVEKQA